MGINKNTLSENQFERLDGVLDELTENQMIWLSGYLEGRMALGQPSEKKSSSEPAKSIANVTILYGTETGNAQELAEKMAEKAAFKNISAKVYSLYDYSTNDLAGEDNLAVIVSTHGEGEIPEMAADFYGYLNDENALTLENVSFSVLALGDKTYKHFCTSGEQVYDAMKSLGAYNIVPISKCDVDYELDAEIWMNNFLNNVTPASDDSVVESPETREMLASYSKTQPFYAEILAKEKITGEGSEKEVYHVELSLKGSGLNYEPGDAVGIFTKNPAELVNAIIESEKLDAQQKVFVKAGQLTFHEALTNHVEITVLTYDLLNKYQQNTNNEKLRILLDDEKACDEYLHGHDVLDLLIDFPFEWNASKLIEILRPIPPRLYSISSSQDEVGEQIHATIALVRFQQNDRERVGACTSHVIYDIEVGETVPIYIDKNPSFKLPVNNSAIIMVGAGTGIAPYRGFMQQRRKEGYCGYSWLFYGDQRHDSDFLYKNEWEELLDDESLERLDVAFSRDQEEKIYVQHKLIENQEEVFEWIENGAYFYLCGDMKNMAKDVNITLLEIIKTQGGVSEEQAEKYLKMLKREKRFQTDVY